MLTLDHILRIGGIPEASRIKLLRHTPTEVSAPEEAWKEGWLHEYEKMHPQDFVKPDYIVTFIPVDRKRVRFLWVKKVDDAFDRSKLVRDPTYRFQNHYSLPGIALDLTRIHAFDDLEGRMIAEWDRPTRRYHQWHRKQMFHSANPFTRCRGSVPGLCQSFPELRSTENYYRASGRKYGLACRSLGSG